LAGLVQNPLLFGIIGALVAVAMLVTELMGHRIFTLQLTGTCGVPLWTLFGTYAVLQLIVWRYSGRRSVDLTVKEIERWGPTLEEVTPLILEMYQANTTVRDIASALQKSHGVPPDITLRYIVALGRHIRENRPAAPPRAAPVADANPPPGAAPTTGRDP
jgi:hypothetical protein